ncbi:YkvA family protein [Sutcliffiella deserti]|uniref:YkvA family protein n=1 Tax=Sutcliffiella deserti TaxID=2875501 RepID=UPI001CC1A1CA|nr:DUF1232 domain-containing protein [Sutcliffiella deserti]
MLKKQNELSKKGIPSLYEAWTDIRILLKLATDWKNKKYTDLSRVAIFMIFITIVYFFNPFDIIPDFLIGLGFLDDVVVVSFLYFLMGKEIDKYKLWRESQVQEG